MNLYSWTIMPGRRPLHALRFAVGCLILSLTGWGAAQPMDATPQGVGERIREITPSHPAPTTAALVPVGEDSGSMRLMGVDLLQNGTPLAGECPRLDGNAPLDVVGYWCPAAVISGRIPMTIRFWSRDYMIGRGEELVIGPASGEAPWEPGGVYRQKHTIGLPQIAGAINGHVSLSIHLAGGGAGPESPALQQIDLLVTPRIGAGRISRTVLEAKLERGAEPLSKSFRLGRGASVTVPLGIHGRTVKGLVILSSFAYGSVAQDKPVVEVGVNDGVATRTLSLLSGVHTARGDYDYYPPGTLNHAKPASVESQDADYLDASGAPFRRHRYAGILPLDPPLANLESITFQLCADVVVDVFDVALVFAAPVSPPPVAPSPATAVPALSPTPPPPAVPSEAASPTPPATVPAPVPTIPSAPDSPPAPAPAPAPEMPAP